MDSNKIFNSELAVNYQFQELINQQLNAQCQLANNPYAMQILRWNIEKIEFLKRILAKSPRFPWQSIQLEMDRLYKIDHTLTGYTIQFDFVECLHPNRAKISLSINN